MRQRGWTVLAIILAACSGSHGSGADAGDRDAGMDSATSSMDGSAADAATDAAVTIDSGPVVGCPAALPAPSSACMPVGTQCTYGDDPRLGCRAQTTCLDGQWAIALPLCDEINGTNCPPTMPAVNQTCDGLEPTICTYDGTICGCTSCTNVCGGTPRWVCSEPPVDTRCPTIAADVGQPCSPNGLDCSYGSCFTSTESQLRCEDGTWTSVPVPCPD